MPARKPKSRPKKKKSSPQSKKRRKTSQKQPTSRSKRQTRPKARATQAVEAPRAPLIQLSPERKMDVLGVLLALAGCVVLLSLFPGNSGVLSGWALFWRKAFGWGVYLFPLLLLLLGGWLMLRAVERIPAPTSERVLGVGVLFFNLLLWLHLLTFPADRAESLARAALGQGGGAVGAALQVALVQALGWWGTAVVALAFLIIGLVLALDVSVLDLVRWLAPLRLRLQDAWDEWRAARRKRPAYTAGVPPPQRSDLRQAPRRLPIPLRWSPKPAPGFCLPSRIFWTKAPSWT